MIEKQIRALKDFELKTIFGSHYLSKDEVKRVRFKNERKFQSLLKFGNFVEAARDEKESKNIFVVLPDEEEVEPREEGITPENDIDFTIEEVIPDNSEAKGEVENFGCKDVRSEDERQSEELTE